MLYNLQKLRFIKGEDKLERIIVLLILILFAINSFAMDVGCVVGGCENKAETDQEEMYECVCPSRDTVGTILDVIGVLTLPLQFFSNKPRFDVGARGIEGLIEKGCKCKPKFRNYQEYRQYYYGDQQDTSNENR